MNDTPVNDTPANDTIVIIPTYNERDNLVPIVERALAATDRVDILIVDDDSPDGTGQLADSLAWRFSRVHYLPRAGKEGLGTAYLAGFAWARDAGYDAFIEMDADGSHHPEDLPTILDLLRGSDMVLGSRWVRGGRVENWPLHRALLSRGGNVYTRLALGIPVKDATGGFRGIRRAALDRVDLDGIESHGYCFQVDLLWRVLQAGLSVTEFPITFTERVHGVSKMSGSIVSESLRRVTTWGVKRRADALRELVLHHRRLPSVRRNRRVVAAGAARS